MGSFQSKFLEFRKLKFLCGKCLLHILQSVSCPIQAILSGSNIFSTKFHHLRTSPKYNADKSGGAVQNPCRGVANLERSVCNQSRGHVNKSDRRVDPSIFPQLETTSLTSKPHTHDANLPEFSQSQEKITALLASGQIDIAWKRHHLEVKNHIRLN